MKDLCLKRSKKHHLELTENLHFNTSERDLRLLEQREVSSPQRGQKSGKEIRQAETMSANHSVDF